MKRGLLSIIFIGTVFLAYAEEDFPFLKMLNLTAEQKTLITAMMDKKMIEHETLMIRLQKKHLELKEYLLQDPADPEKVRVLLREMAEIEADLRYSRFLTDYEIEKNLDADQKRKFREMRARREDMMERKMHRPRKLWF